MCNLDDDPTPISVPIRVTTCGLSVMIIDSRTLEDHGHWTVRTVLPDAFLCFLMPTVYPDRPRNRKFHLNLGSRYPELQMLIT